MKRGVDHDQARPAALEPCNAAWTAMRRTIVDYPEDARGGAIRLAGHYLPHQSVEARDARAALAPAEDFGTANVPGRQVRPRSAAPVFVFHAHRLPGGRWETGVATLARLDAGLLVGAQNAIGGVEPPATPPPGIEIQDASGLVDEGRVAREDPAAVVPRPDGVLRQPPPQGGLSHRGDEPTAEHFALDFGEAEARERQPQFVRKFTSQGLDLNHGPGGGKRGGRPCLGNSSRPARRCSKYRLRHLLTTWRGRVEALGTRLVIPALSRIENH